jgi:aquaporin Z
MAMAYLFGPISKGAFNPAVAVGLSVMKIAPWSDQWVYVAGCFGGGILAGIIFRILNPDDK